MRITLIGYGDMTDTTTHQNADKYDEGQKDAEIERLRAELRHAEDFNNRNGALIDATQRGLESANAKIERLEAGIAEIQTKASIIKAAALYPADELIADEIIRKCDELLKLQRGE